MAEDMATVMASSVVVEDAVPPPSSRGVRSVRDMTTEGVGDVCVK